MKRVNICIGILLSISSSFFSCSDNEELNSQEMVAYLRLGGELFEPKLTYTPYKDGVYEDYEETEIILQITRGLEADAIFTLSPDQSLVNVYNEENGTNYAFMPEGSYNETNREISLRRGESQGTYTISVNNPLNLAESAGENDGFILPIRISKIESVDKGLRISEDYNLIYFVVKFNPFYNIDDVSETLTGATFYDKTGWTASASNIWTAGYEASNAVDGNTGTSWASIESLPTLTIDMQNQKELKGVRVLSNYIYYNYYYFYVTQINIYTSNDNERWTGQGDNVDLIFKITGVDSYVYFYNPINCRYIRFEITDTYQGYSSFAEIDVFN